MSDVPAVTVDQLPTDAVVLDVREPDEWVAGHAVGATHIALGDLPARLGDVPAGDPLYVICRSGARSGQAVEWLRQQGMSGVNVTGGTQAWAAAGLPMTSENGADPVVA